MIEIAISSSDVAKIRAELLSDESVESCAIAFASQAIKDGEQRLIVRAIELVSDTDYSRRQFGSAELKPELVARISKRARRQGLSLIFIHSHPGSDQPRFSEVDARGEELLRNFLDQRNSGKIHATIVVSRGGVCARLVGGEDECRLVELGRQRKVLTSSDGREADYQAFDRQVRAFGSRGQQVLAGLTVGIVGLGGTGSIVAEQLSHLGVRRFVLIDSDELETSNLNRVVGSTPADIGQPKVDVAARMIRGIAPESAVRTVQADVVYARTAGSLFDCDFIFGCTDSHGSRSVLQQIAYQYFIPCIDVGSTIHVTDGRVVGVFGRVQTLAPGFGCLSCSGLLDYEQVRRDMMSVSERRLDPYIVGAREPAPSVVSLNGTVVSLAITMFLAYVTGIPSDARYLIYNALRSSLRPVQTPPAENCFICSPTGVLAKGDALALYARQD